MMLSTAQAAAVASCSDSLIRRYCRSGWLRADRGAHGAWRVPLSEAFRFAKERQTRRVGEYANGREVAVRYLKRAPQAPRRAA